MKWIVFFLSFLAIGCSTKKRTIEYSTQLEIFRTNYKAGFLEDPRSPLTNEDLPYLDFYVADPAWNIECNCTPATMAKPFEMPTYSGVTRTYIHQYTATCKKGDKTIELKLYKNIHHPINPMYKNNLFLPFKDFTNGETTYGGGRYINLMTTDIIKGKINIDFNTCYNPWCAYSDGFNCPIPPKDNHLSFEVLAGEKKFTGDYKSKK